MSLIDKFVELFVPFSKVLAFLWMPSPCPLLAASHPRTEAMLCLYAL
jgi:hypothetical protein